MGNTLQIGPMVKNTKFIHSVWYTIIYKVCSGCNKCSDSPQQTENKSCDSDVACSYQIKDSVVFLFVKQSLFSISLQDTKPFF